jgi:hypothetical protein
MKIPTHIIQNMTTPREMITIIHIQESPRNMIIIIMVMVKVIIKQANMKKSIMRNRTITRPKTIKIMVIQNPIPTQNITKTKLPQLLIQITKRITEFKNH